MGTSDAVVAPQREVSELIASSTSWGVDEEAVLQRLIEQWHILADVSRGDLVLWVRTTGGDFVAVSHVRPATVPTAFTQQVVGSVAKWDDNPVLRQVFEKGGVVAPAIQVGTAWNPDVGIAVPVTVEGAVAVLGCYRASPLSHRKVGFSSPRVPVCSALWNMVVEGSFPDPVMAKGKYRGVARIGDGVVVIAPDDVVDYASPAAVGVLHRMGWPGDVVGTLWTTMLEKLSSTLGALPDTGGIPMTHISWRGDIIGRDCTLAVHALPLWYRGDRVGMLAVCRDVTELRACEQQLMSQEATIREINHRVKNNLQTVAALLRMQRRRIDNSAAQGALTEAISRVSTMGVVHDLLSQNVDDAVDFDDLLDSGLLLAPTGVSGAQVRLVRHGSIGTVQAQDATVLALVIHELLANSVEHGFNRADGEIEVTGWRRDHQLRVDVADNGVGCDPELIRVGNGLGTHIVRSLVRSELGGSIAWQQREPRGTRVRLDVTLRPV